MLSVITIGLWARFRQGYKRTLGERFHRGAQQGWIQVLARVGWATTLAILYGLVAEERGILVGFVGALAASTADAWGTELGVLSNQMPRTIISPRRLPAGEPGGITLLGIVAGLGASWLLGFAGLLFNAIKSWIAQITLDPVLLWLPIAAMLGGMAGSLTDSLLGAAAQGIYYCEHCKERSEYRLHTCGRRTEQVRGWAWLTNEGINMVCTLVGAAITAGAVSWLARFGAGW